MIKKLTHAYKVCAILVFNTLIAFIIINLLLFVGMQVKNTFREKNNGYQKLYDVPLQLVYPGYNQKEIDRIVNETWIRGGLEFEPFTQMKDRAFTGKYVNVSPNGYRITVPQGKWPPEPDALNVFLFGGSTTFNYGVPDNETIASYLQKKLRAASPHKDVWVYNFGRGFYYSSQELILFERLLVNKKTPDIAIFIDGLNDFTIGDEDKPANTDELHKYIDNINSGTAPREEFTYLIDQIPLVRFAEFLKIYGKKVTIPLVKTLSEQQEEKNYGNKELLTNVITRYFANKKIIESVSDAHQIKSVFVLQPVPHYKYDIKYHIFYNKTDPHLNQTCNYICYTKYGYPLLASILKSRGDDKNLLWLGDMQENEHKPLYVDSVHYTAEMPKKIADRIYSFLQKDHLLATVETADK